MNQQFIGNDFANQKMNNLDKLTIDKVDNAAEVNMPLCMKVRNLSSFFLCSVSDLLSDRIFILI
jgi:hypothetical protein